MKNIIFTIMMFVFTAAVIGGAWTIAKKYMERGKVINKMAWEASYTERHLPVPESGPREGYWGSRVGSGVADDLTVWRDSEAHIDGLIDVDSAGYQQYRSSAPGKRNKRMVILGGSTASGAYASSIPATYFNVIGRRLEELRLPTDIDIIAAGAWKSIQEIRALERYLQATKPDIVVFLNGLNDLTNGATSIHLYGEPYKTANGEIVDVLYHSHDYERRVSAYLQNMSAARALTSAGRIPLLVVLQPSLNERARRTGLEEKLLAASLVPHASSQVLSESYAAIGESLNHMTGDGNFYFLDGSRVFDSENETVFADIWHFSDVGHRVLGLIMAEKIAEIMSNGKHRR